MLPDGKVTYLHPADGVYPEKVNAGRVGVNQNMRSIGENVNPIKVRRGQGGSAGGCGGRRAHARSMFKIITLSCRRRRPPSLGVTAHHDDRGALTPPPLGPALLLCSRRSSSPGA